MRTSHGVDWPRRVHCRTWYCDIGHGEIAEFDNEVDWRAHMRDSNAHPGRKKGPTDLQLKGLVVKKQQSALRDDHVCPLCEETPEKINILGGKGNREDMATILEDHIARHIKDLAFMSLATPDDELGDGTEDKPTTSDGAEQHVSSPGSAPYPPTVLELMLEVSPGSSHFPEEAKYIVTHKSDRALAPSHLLMRGIGEQFRESKHSYNSRQFKSTLERLGSVGEPGESYAIQAWLNEPEYAEAQRLGLLTY